MQVVTNDFNVITDYTFVGDICDSEIHRISCPTLIINGKKDALVPMEHPLHLHKKIKDAKYEKIIRHWLCS